MSSDLPPLLNPAPKKRRLGCLAWFGIFLLVCVLTLVGLHWYGRHLRTNDQLQKATAALLANDPATALDELYSAHVENPDDASIAQLYENAQKKWMEALDAQIATKTAAQRYMLLREEPVKGIRSQLSEPFATTLQQFIDRNSEDTRVQIDETVERAMALVEAGKFSEGWNAMETLRICYTYPGLTELWNNFDQFYTERLVIHAGDLGQNEQIASARNLLAQLKKNQHPTVEAQNAALFRIDLGEYLMCLNQATTAAAKHDPQTAQTKLQDAQRLFPQLLRNPELQHFFANLPSKDRASPLAAQFTAAQTAIQRMAKQGGTR